MRKHNIELFVGIFVFIGIMCLGYLTFKLGKMEIFASDDTIVTAKFSSVAGLRPGANVEISGVTVGKVASIELDAIHVNAIVTMSIDHAIQVTDDTFASIKTSGLIGDKYVNLSLGGGDPLPAGEMLTETESSLDIEALVSKYVFGGVE